MCQEEMDEAFDIASREAETERLTSLSRSLVNRPDWFGNEPGDDKFWEIEIELGRRRKGE